VCVLLRTKQVRSINVCVLTPTSVGLCPRYDALYSVHDMTHVYMTCHILMWPVPSMFDMTHSYVTWLVHVWQDRFLQVTRRDTTSAHLDAKQCSSLSKAPLALHLSLCISRHFCLSLSVYFSLAIVSLFVSLASKSGYVSLCVSLSVYDCFFSVVRCSVLQYVASSCSIL